MTRKTNAYLILLFLAGVLASCTSEQVPAPSNCTDPPNINLVSSTDAGCNLSNGAITVAGTGGEGTLTYTINGASSQVSPTFTNLAAGTYTIEVTDANNCSSSLEVTVLNSDGLNIDVATVGTVCGENQGSIMVTATGAQGAVEYKLNEGSFQSSNQFMGLAQGGYTLTVRDAGGCEIQQEVDIKTDIGFNAIQLIVQNNCAIPSCHSGSQAPDFSVNANIIASASRIKIRTTSRTMPPGGRTISDDEIAAISCWVDDGASGN